MDARTAEFLEHVQSGGLVETGDWMPDEYRKRLTKFVEMHANSELMGVLPERDWILRAPTLQRKLALTAKIQDEVGHAQLLYRVVEDLGKPRDACLDDLIAGRSKFHNVFHYPTKTWGDVGVIAWLVDAAAIISQKALLKCSYAPYARIMRKICWEESFHILHGRDVVLTLVTGTDAPARARPGGNRPLVGAADDVPRQPDSRGRRPDGPLADQEPGERGRAAAVPRGLRAAGVGARPDASRPEAPAHATTASGSTREPDWDRLMAVVSGNGPASAERLAFRRAVARGGRLGLARRARRGGLVAIVYEVFRRERAGSPMQHAGSIAAPDDRFAWIYAREQYGRRQESAALWLVPRHDVHQIHEFPDEFDLKYRRVDGYSIKARLKEARERAGTAVAAENAARLRGAFSAGEKPL